MCTIDFFPKEGWGGGGGQGVVGVDSVFGLVNTCLVTGQAPHEDINRRFRIEIILTCFIIIILLIAKYRM